MCRTARDASVRRCGIGRRTDGCSCADCGVPRVVPRRCTVWKQGIRQRTNWGKRHFAVLGVLGILLLVGVAIVVWTTCVLPSALPLSHGRVLTCAPHSVARCASPTAAHHSYFNQAPVPDESHPFVPLYGNLDLDEFVLNTTVNPHSVNARWAQSQDVVYSLEGGTLYAYESLAGKSVLVAAEAMAYNGQPLDVFDYAVSPGTPRVCSRGSAVCLLQHLSALSNL